MKTNQPNSVKLNRSIGTWEVMAAGVALVVASSTLVSEFTGYFTLGAAFCVALLMGFFINLLLAVSAADLSVAYPKAGAFTQPVQAWLAAAGSAMGSGGDAPQLAVGQLMFGKAGYYLMAVASVSATVGTMTIAYAAMPRILYSIARNGRFFGPLSRPFARLHPRYNTPVVAIGFTFLLYLIPALQSSKVIDWLYSAAYAWIILYGVFHLLAIINRIWRPQTTGAFDKRWLIPAAATGILTAGVGLYYAFAGAHTEFGLRALIVLAAALIAAGVSFITPSHIAWKIPKIIKQVVPVSNEGAKPPRPCDPEIRRAFSGRCPMAEPFPRDANASA